MAAAVAATCAAGALVFMPRERLLMRSATKVMTTGDKRESAYAWRTDHTLIQMTYRASGDRFELAETDTQTGLSKPLSAFNQRWRNALRAKTVYKVAGAQAPVIAHNPPRFALSPDGKWLLFASNITNRDDAQPFTIVAAALDCTKELRWRSSSSWSAPFWLNDNHRWVEPVPRGANGQVSIEFILHDTANPAKNGRVAISSMPLPLYCTSQADRLVVVDNNSGRIAASASVTDYGSLRGLGRPRRFAARFPRGSEVRSIALSARGDRLAWGLMYDDVPEPLEWASRTLRIGRLRPHMQLGLYVSGIDGSGMAEIGHKPLLPYTPGNGEMDNLQWTHGDSKLSFTYKDVLYTVPVPAPQP
jgi:hypothetical protein